MNVNGTKLGPRLVRTYGCAKCGENFDSAQPTMCGAANLQEFKEGESVPDILLFVCDECAKTLQRQ